MSNARQRGTIVRWDDEKGFGFIAPDAGTEDVFIHIKALAGGRRPVTGDRVLYFSEKDQRNRDRAIQVQFAAASSLLSARALALVLAAAFLSALALAAWLGRIAAVFPVVYAMMSAVTVAAYRHDKTSARQGGSRLPESALHLLELFGGWPGAVVAQQWFRHKNRKLSYQLLFWLIVAAHLGVWIRSGSK